MEKRIIVFAAVLMLVACKTGGGPTVSHEITYSAKGTRSEARHGHLLVDGIEVPWVFSRVVCGPTFYVLQFRGNLWGDDGYWPDASASAPSEAGTQIPVGSLKKGYFLSSKRLAGTPAGWIWVQWGSDKAAFVAPDRLEQLIREEKIPDQTDRFSESQRRPE